MSPVDRNKWPYWVRFPLWGLRNRVTATRSRVAAVILALLSIAMMLVRWHFVVGALFLVGAVWYDLAIRWVDRHGEWK